MTDGGHAKPGAVDMGTITALSVREQVEALAQALLREFMHRRGYTKTLQTFDRECPRDARTIASRQLMRQLLEIPAHAFPSRLSGDGAAAAEDAEGADGKGRTKKKKPPPPTYMEELCSYRLQKREVQQRRQEAEERRRAGAEAVPPVVDPSEAEMEEWRAAAAEKERCIAEARERRERKQRKREKLRRKREEQRRQHEEAAAAEGAGGAGGVARASHDAVASHRHGMHCLRLDDANIELLRPMGGSGAALCAPAEPEVLFGPLDGRGEERPAAHAVGSHWMPCGGDLPGPGRGAPFIPDAPAPVSSATAGASERTPSFLVGEGMSLMSERMQAAKKRSALEDWRPPAPTAASASAASSFISPFSAVRGAGGAAAASAFGGGGGNRLMRGSAGFTPTSAASAWPRHASREGSPAAVAPAFPYASAGQHMVSHSQGGLAHSPSPALGEATPTRSVPPPPAGGILKMSAEPRRGFDGNARPACSAMRKGAPPKDASSSSTGNDAAAAAGANNGTECVDSSGRKKRKVTILAD
ncbi:uncharacterized protein Tco025E_04539 [Trypanosoma conorhini]|uniref:MINDY4 N-terminal dimerisation domain-containing protein n=1 Tax=Trypanosoma conorhini TaxID=83891 RepID=A0A422PM06_9TRYP|nr:uncharacterized protein Tco025E_04539 [Trypanosoma conorhini]RNF18731.1 hypothetical protein Tco025E_04539 [Trypanosoma conorhini]